MKIKLVAPLICRNGTVLLKPKNVHIINEQGIEELMEEFDLKNILTTKIGTDYVGPVQTDNQIPTRNSNNTRPVQTDNQTPGADWSRGNKTAAGSRGSFCPV